MPITCILASIKSSGNQIRLKSSQKWKITVKRINHKESQWIQSAWDETGSAVSIAENIARSFVMSTLFQCAAISPCESISSVFNPQGVRVDHRESDSASLDVFYWRWRPAEDCRVSPLSAPDWPPQRYVKTVSLWFPKVFLIARANYRFSLFAELFLWSVPSIFTLIPITPEWSALVEVGS